MRSYTFIVPIIALAVTIGLLTLGAGKAPPAAPTSELQPSEGMVIQITGRASVYKQPSKVEITVAFVDENSTPKVAMDVVATESAGFVQRLNKLDIADLEIQTVSSTVSPVYSSGYNEPNPRLLHYTATSILVVRTTNTADGAKLVSTAFANNAARLNSVNFVLGDIIAAREEGLKLAITAARRKADVIAKQLGMSVQSAVGFQDLESYGSYDWYPYGGYRSQAQMSSQISTTSFAPASRSDRPAGDGGETFVESGMKAGSLPVNTNVQVSFKLVPTR
jgi:uncharacterized protein YggE